MNDYGITKQHDLNKILSDVKKETEKAGLPLGEINPIVDIANATSFYGQCVFKNGIYSIRISKYLNDENAIRETVAHELCHAHETGRRHGVGWKQRAVIMNREYGYHITRVGGKYVDNDGVLKEKVIVAPNKDNYILKCVKCGWEYKTSRLSKSIKHPELFKCSKCRGNLERIK